MDYFRIGDHTLKAPTPHQQAVSLPQVDVHQAALTRAACGPPAELGTGGSQLRELYLDSGERKHIGPGQNVKIAQIIRVQVWAKVFVSYVSGPLLTRKEPENPYLRGEVPCQMLLGDAVAASASTFVFSLMWAAVSVSRVTRKEGRKRR